RKPVDIQQLLTLLRNALEKKHLEEDNWRMLRRLSLLHAIGATVSVGLQPETTLTETIQLVVSLLDLTSGGIWWAPREASTPPLAASVGLSESLANQMTERVAGLLEYLRAKPLALERPWFSETIFDSAGQEWHFRLVPLKGVDSLIGCMAVGGLEWVDGQTEEAEVLGAVAGQVGVAMENMRLFADLSSAYDRLKEAQAQIAQAEKLSAMGRVVSGIAHELNNPLMAIFGYAELLCEGAETIEVPTLARHIYTQARRCADIVQKLLAFARQDRTAFIPVKLREIISSALAAVEHSRPPTVTVVLEANDDIPTTLGDPGGLQQVIVNIVSNAYQAMSPQGGKLTVSVGLDNDFIIIRIADTGPGIPPDALARIFDPFFTTKSVGQGTGLGLSISLGIIQAHGGELSADNLPEGGAVFQIRLPIRKSTFEAEAVLGTVQQSVQDAPWLQ
ncbi:MAG: sensor histidine kinase, partial [Candidatus Zipacnadales bacterium]